MFLSALVCLFVSGIYAKLLDRFSKKNPWKNGTWAANESL